MTTEERDRILLAMAPVQGDDVEPYRAALEAWTEGDPVPERP